MKIKDLMILMFPFIIFSVVMIFAVEFIDLDEKKPIETSSTNITSTEMGLFLKANEERTEKLDWSYCLHDLAIDRSKDMVEKDYFSHEDPETGNVETWNKIDEACGKYSKAGENLVMRFSSYEEAHEALMNSKLHRDNIVNVKFKEMGVGCYENVCTELFGSFVNN